MSADPDRRLAEAETSAGAAEAALQAALLSGADTTAARSALDDAEKELAAARHARKVATDAADEREADRVTVRADALCQGAIAGMKTMFGDFRLPAVPVGLQIGE
jgi:hypothetical protein